MNWLVPFIIHVYTISWHPDPSNDVKLVKSIVCPGHAWETTSPVSFWNWKLTSGIPVIDKTKESFDDVAHVESTEMEIL